MRATLCLLFFFRNIVWVWIIKNYKIIKTKTGLWRFFPGIKHHIMLFTSGEKNNLMSFFFRIGVSGFEKLKIKKLTKQKENRPTMLMFMSHYVVYIWKERGKNNNKNKSVSSASLNLRVPGTSPTPVPIDRLHHHESVVITNR